MEVQEAFKLMTTRWGMDEHGDRLWQAWPEGSRVRLSVGSGAYQYTDLTPEQAKELGNALLDIAGEQQ